MFKGNLVSGTEQHICRQVATFPYSNRVKPSNTHRKARPSPSTSVQLRANPHEMLIEVMLENANQ